MADTRASCLAALFLAWHPATAFSRTDPSLGGAFLNDVYLRPARSLEIWDAELPLARRDGCGWHDPVERDLHHPSRLRGACDSDSDDLKQTQSPPRREAGPANVDLCRSCHSQWSRDRNYRFLLLG